ncbi:MAG: carbamoyltransferase C-terminal domain-containing protein [Candidatus Omnitrophota bacterium]|nr:carbamoyltransferase C-terminal domain-containing protein [Candidatus Omnitrophota bacterium]
MYILGINSGHNSTACLHKDGRIIACASEERFKRVKNYSGYPEEAIKYLLGFAGIQARELDLVMLGNIMLPPFASAQAEGAQPLIILHWIFFRLRAAWSYFEFKLPFLRPLDEFLYDRIMDLAGPVILNREKKLIALKLNIPQSKVMAVEHHTAHAFAAYYASPFNDKEALVFTLDGEGDKLCATVNVYRGARYERIASTHLGHSIGWIYMDATQFLGMKPMEHEYKVMGLAPYAKSYGAEKVYDLISDIIGLDKRNPLRFRSKFDTHRTLAYFQKILRFQRFDFIAGAVQKLTEEVVTEWVRQAVQKTGIKRIALGGGVFMNVKLNMKIMELPEIEEMFVLPSCGDESTPMGACLYGYQALCAESHEEFLPQPLKDLYLGPEFSDAAIERALNSEGIFAKYTVTRPAEIEKEIARLLSQNQIVARVSGRMEWGARALGNRSILAKPSDYDNLRVLNEWIKDRDFWMPFTPTILKEREPDYIENPKNISAPYMALAFRTRELAVKHLRAAIHPYDFTARVQSLEEDGNPGFYKIIQEFQRLSGIGGVLNTSFNLHGEPMVCSPADALRTMEKSELKYLAMGSFLISKK